MSEEEKHTVALPGARLALVVHAPPGRRRVPCVIACHGLSASKDSDKYLLLGDALPAAGLALARFDFRGCGESSRREAEQTNSTPVGGVGDEIAQHPGQSRDGWPHRAPGPKPRSLSSH